MDINNSYIELKDYYDNVLNKDNKTIKNTNDICTPIDCIEEMINKIPKDIFKKKDIKILDPCCGNGNFNFVIYKKFNINPNNFYFNDTNKERINNVKSIFKNFDNIYQEDYLNTNYSIKFDLIVANPPYSKIMENGKRASKNHNLIKDFLEKSLSLLNQNGCLLFITPDNWMSLSDRNNIIKKITSLQIIYLNIHTAKKYFKKIGSSFTWYIIQNKNYYKDIEVEGIYKNKLYKSFVNSEIRDYIPLFYNKTVYDILKKTIDIKRTQYNRFKVETNSFLHKTTKKDYINNYKTDKFKYKLIHTPKQTVWSCIKHKYQDNYKVFISLTDKYKVFVDNCGMTQSIAYILCNNKEEAEYIKNILSHPIYVFINNICRYGNFNNVRILQRFPIPEKLMTSIELIRCNKIIYDYFNITIDEIKFIEHYL